MEEQFVTYEIALKLKKLGFNEECFGYYHVNEGYTKGYAFCYSENTRNSDCSVLAPLWQQVIDWFRDEHNIVIEISRHKYFDTFINSYMYQVICKIYKNKELSRSVIIRDNNNNQIFYSYEEAREQAILKTIKLCQNKN